MPMIPPPVMSVLKIQINHTIMDSSRKVAWTVSSIPGNLTNAPLILKRDAVEQINGTDTDDGLNVKTQKALEDSNNAQKLDMIHNGNVEFARMVDRMNTTAYTTGGINGFNSISFNSDAIGSKPNYWFEESDRNRFRNINDCKIFENNGVRQYSGNPDDDVEVKKYVDDMSNNKANWSTLLVEYSKAIGRLITKILIFIGTTILQTKVAIRAALTLLKIMEEVFEYTSSVFQTVVTVGGPTAQTSVITA